MDRKDFPHEGFFLFSFFVYSDYPVPWIKLLLITNSNPIYILFMAPLCRQEIKVCSWPLHLG